jgi:multidrug resistance efflux pump
MHPLILLLFTLVLATGCSRTNNVVKADTVPQPQTPEPPTAPLVRITGLVRALRVYSVQVPQIAGVQGNRVTLVTLVPNGSTVKQGEDLAEFDNTKQLDDALEAEAKFDDLNHQAAQKAAQNRSDAAVRMEGLKQAEVDLGKAEIQLKKGPILNEIDRIKNEARAESARALVQSLLKSHAARKRAETAALRVLELQRDRQKVALDRAKTNAQKLTIKAPLSGMVALENIWKGGSMGHAQEGDQLWGGQSLLKIFDPSEMVVDAQVGEPDGTRLTPSLRARVRLDAYPDMELDAAFVSSSPVAVTALGSPVKNFNARFRLLKADPRLLPDLSAAVIIQP